MKITTLVENTVMVSQGHIGEHGLSFLVEHDSEKQLFDTGQGMALLNNADKLGFCVQDFKKVVLSHGHYDHAGGLKLLVESGVSFELTAHPDAFDEKLALFPGKGFIPIGIPGGKEFFVENNVPLHIEAGPVEIAPGIMTTGEIPMTTDFEKIEPMLFVRKNGKEIPDPLADDQALILDTEKGIVILLGCAHRGVVNTLQHVAGITGAKTVHAVIGGLHLERAPESQIEKTIEALREPKQAAVRFKTPTGWTDRIRLKDAHGKRLLLPEGKTPQDMGPEFLTDCYTAAMRLAQESLENDTFRTPNRRFRNCKQAMEKYVTECNRDHHGNAFMEYFGDKALASVNKKTVAEFVTWLMQKYDSNEATVSKKVFAASALFRWMKRKGWWLGDNPFSEALTSVRFADPKQFKDVIEADELARIKTAMMDERYKELRVLCEILFTSGLRPSEAMRIKREDVDGEKLVLNYQRTKQKKKTPDWRRIPIPARLIAFLANEGITKGPLVNLTPRRAATLLKEVTEIAQVGGLTLKTFRKNFAYMARLAGASVDDVNLYQGRMETLLEKHYTTNPWFIAHQCRSWVDGMFGDRAPLEMVK